MSASSQDATPEGFRPLATLCVIGGVRGRLDLRVFEGLVQNVALGLSPRNPIPPEKARLLRLLLQTAIDEIAVAQEMPIRSLECSIKIRSAKARRLATRVRPAKFPRLVRTILLANMGEWIEDGAHLRINPCRAIPILISRRGRTVTEAIGIADLARAASLGPGTLSAIYERWKQDILLLLSTPDYMEFLDLIARPSGHDILGATDELERLVAEMT